MQAGAQGAGDGISRAQALDESLARAHQLAVAQGHGTVALEHLLFALTDDPDAVAILAASNISVEQLRTDVSGHLGRMSERAAPASGSAPRPGADLLRILQLAGMAARQSQRRTMDGGIVLAAVIGDGNSSAAGLLKAHGLTFEDVIRVLQTTGAPRQQEIAPAPARAELPPPLPEEAATPPLQPPSAREQPRPVAGEDPLAKARARVRQAEPAVLEPFPQSSVRPAQATAHREPTPAAPGLGHPDGAEARRPNLTVAPSARPAPPDLPARLELPRQDVARTDQTLQDPRRPPPLSEPPPRRNGADRPPATRPPPPPHAVSDPRTQPTTTPLTEPHPAMPPPLPGARNGPPGSMVQHPVAPPPPAPPYAAPRPQPPYQPRQMPAVAPRPPMPQNPLAPRPAQPQRPDLQPLPPPAQLPALAPMPTSPYAMMPGEPLEIVHAAAGLPAVVRRHTPVLVEIRIPRGQIDVPRQGPQAPPPHLHVTRAVTARLTSGPVSGVSIEPRTPETAWLGPADADTRAVVWQYVLLPTRTGTFAVTLSVSGRTFSPVGMSNDPATAAETFAVRVKPERGRFWRRLLGTLTLLTLGGAIGWSLAGPLAGLVKALFEMARG